MTRSRSTRGRRTRQQGAALLTAVFLITAIAAIAAVMIALVGTTSVSTGNSLRAHRAYAAAQSGLDVAIDRALAGNCAAFTATVDGYRVAAQCTAQPGQDEGEGGYTVFRLTARATAGSLDDGSLVSRRLSARVAND